MAFLTVKKGQGALVDPQQVSIILGIVLIVLQAGVAIVQFLIQQRQSGIMRLQDAEIERLNRVIDRIS